MTYSIDKREFNLESTFKDLSLSSSIDLNFSATAKNNHSIEKEQLSYKTPLFRSVHQPIDYHKTENYNSLRKKEVKHIALKSRGV